VIHFREPESRWLVSFAEAEASIHASQRLGFIRYPNMALDIFILELTIPNLNRIGSMLIPYITRYKNKSPS
jgi:hypothetical protein